MNDPIITDITNFIFVSDEPEKADAIFLPGGSHPEQPEYAAELYGQGYAKWLILSGGISVNGISGRAFAQKQTYTAAIIDPTVNSLPMYS